MKKVILSFIFCIIFSLSAGQVSAYGEDASGQKPNQYIEFLNVINVFDEKDNADDYTTRADFAVYLARILNIDEYYRSEKIYFTDVPATYWKSNSINALAEHGIISGDSERAFRPDDNITYDEAAALLVRVLGYEGRAQLEGGYPSGYRAMFNKLELSEGVNSDENGYTKANTARMITNALNTVVAERDYSSPYNVYTTDNSDTLLYKQRSIIKNKGVVTGIYGISLTYGASPNSGQAVISGVTYDAENAYIRPFLGKKTDFYYSYHDGDDYGKIVYASERSDSDIIEIKAEDIDGYNSEQGVLNYACDAKTKSVKIKSGAEVIFNGSKKNINLSDEINNLKFGKITLYNIDGESGYDAVVINSYEICRVTMNNTDTHEIYGDYIEDGVLEPQKYSTVKVFLASGEEISVDTIREDDILTLIRSEDYLEVYVSRIKINGVVKSIEKDKVIIDGTEYSLNEYVVEKYNLVFHIGEEVSFGLNHDGTIVYAESASADDMKYAYVCNSFYDENEDRFTLRIFTFEGKMVTIDSAKKINIDGQTYKHNKAQDGMFKGKDKRPILIRYTVNDDGKINKIDTPALPGKYGAKESSQSLTITGAFGEKTYFNNQCIGAKNVTNSNTKILMVPSDEKAASASAVNFTIGNTGILNSGTKYQAEVYSIGDDKGIDDVVVIKAEASYIADEGSSPMLVEQLSEGINSEDEIVTVVDGYYKNERVKYTIKMENFPNITLHPGDLIYIAVDPQNEIRDVLMFYCYEGGTPAEQWGTPKVNEWDAYRSFASGYVIKIKDGVVKFGYNNTDTIDEAYLLETWANVVYFDGKTAWKESSSNMITAEMNPVSPDRIITRAIYANITDFYVYRTRN